MSARFKCQLVGSVRDSPAFMRTRPSPGTGQELPLRVSDRMSASGTKRVQRLGICLIHSGHWHPPTDGRLCEEHFIQVETRDRPGAVTHIFRPNG